MPPVVRILCAFASLRCSEPAAISGGNCFSKLPAVDAGGRLMNPYRVKELDTIT